MPYFSIETTEQIEESEAKKIMKKASNLIAAILGKPESVVMVSMKPGTAMIFAGAEGPTAFVCLKSINLSADQCPILSEKICSFVEQEVSVPKGRVFIDFTNLEGKYFGWDGRTL